MLHRSILAVVHEPLCVPCMSRAVLAACKEFVLPYHVVVLVVLLLHYPDEVYRHHLCYRLCGGDGVSGGGDLRLAGRVEYRIGPVRVLPLWPVFCCCSHQREMNEVAFGYSHGLLYQTVCLLGFHQNSCHIVAFAGVVAVVGVVQLTDYTVMIASNLNMGEQHKKVEEVAVVVVVVVVAVVVVAAVVVAAAVAVVVVVAVAAVAVESALENSNTVMVGAASIALEESARTIAGLAVVAKTAT